jgi:acyl-CoA thioesterase-1
MATNAPSGIVKETSRRTVSCCPPLGYRFVNCRATSMSAVLKVFLIMVMVTACSGGNAERASGDASRSSGESAASSAPARSAASGRPTILFVGTSLTAGYGLAPEQSYPALIARRIDSLGLSYQVVNAGVSGQTSAGTLRSIDWLMRQPADIVVLETGANDGLRALSVDTMRTNIQQIIDRVKSAQPTARIYLVAMEAPPNLGPSYTASFRAVYPELAAKNGVTLIPFLLDRVAGVDSLNQGDGIHPNERGARIVADNIWNRLELAP